MTALEAFTLIGAVCGAIVVPTGGIVWAIRLEGRQATHERECAAIRQARDREIELIVQRLEDRDSALAQRFDDQHDAIMASLQSIRQVLERRP